MKILEANIRRSFAEVKKEIFYLTEEINNLKEKISKLNKQGKR